MRNFGLRFFLWLLSLLFLAVGIAATYYAFVVHPDDSRIAMPDMETVGAFSERFELSGSLLTTPWVHTIAMPKEAFKAARFAYKKAYPETTIVSSRRFVSSKQIYVTTGEYPTRLEAIEGVYIPAGQTLTVRPGLAGEFELRFAVYADGSANRIAIRQGASTVIDELLVQPVDAPATQDFFYKNVARFLWPDREAKIRRWRHLKTRLNLAATQPLTVTCTGPGLGCVISDIRALKKSDRPKRNVLMILVDTMRGDAVAGGHAQHIAGVAAAGVSFANAFSPGNMTSPSTNSLLACRKAASLGNMAFAYAVNRRYREKHYRQYKQSVAGVFRDAGYLTAMIGNVSVISEIFGVGVSHGFDQQVAIEAEAYDTPMITRAAEKWLASQGDGPFFLYVHLHGPHAPYRAPWRDIKATFPGMSVFRSYPTVLRWLYQSEISYTDRYLDRIVRTLDNLGLADSTDVVITSDHGDMHTSRRFSGNDAGPDFTGAYFDHGATLLNDEVRVPMIFRGSGIEPGQVSSQMASTLDIGPTLMARAGLEVPEYCEGAPLPPVTGQPSSETDGARTIGSEAFQARSVIFDGRYKYIRMYGPVEKRVYSEDSYSSPTRSFFRRHQLFDLKADPNELSDLSGSQSALLTRAEQEYRSFYNIGDVFELMVDLPVPSQVEIEMPLGLTGSTTDGRLRRLRLLNSTLLFGYDVTRAVVEIRGLTDELPVVRVGSEELPLSMTSMQLPLNVALKDLPLESGGLQTRLPAGDAPAAYLRRIEDDGQKDRRISVGNPAFDKILREWGYLND